MPGIRDARQQILVVLLRHVDQVQHCMHQKQPYTHCRIRLEAYGTTFIGDGYSKANWPDTWNSEMGKQLAMYRAADDLVDQLVERGLRVWGASAHQVGEWVASGLEIDLAAAEGDLDSAVDLNETEEDLNETEEGLNEDPERDE